MLCFSLLVLASGAVVRTDANAESVVEDSADSVAQEDTEIQELSAGAHRHTGKIRAPRVW